MRLVPLSFIILLILTSCTQDIEIETIPKEYHGEWVDEFEEFKMVISSKEIYFVDIAVNDIREIEIDKIYKTSRRKCENCLDYGVRIEYVDDLGREDDIYLNDFNETNRSYMTLLLNTSLVNPDDESRGYLGEEKWFRVH